MATQSQTENKNLALLISGNVIAQLIPFAFSPILSRYYAPEQFGQLALLMGITNPLSTLICLKYDAAIVIPEKEDESRDLLRLSLKLAFFIATGVFLLSLVLYQFTSSFKILQQAKPVLLYVGPVLLCIGISTAVGFMLQRLKKFKQLTMLKILQMAGITLFNLLFILLAVYDGLSIGYLIGWSLSASVALLFIYKTMGGNLLRVENKNNTLTKTYIRFPLYNSVPEFFNTLALSLPVFIFMQQFGEKETGYLNLCRQVLYFPASFISVALSQYYFQQFSENFRTNQKLRPVLNKIALITAPLSLLMVGVIVLAGPWLFAFVFGERWISSGHQAQILCFLFTLQLCVVPMQTMLTATGYNKLFGVFKIASFVVNLILIFPVYTSPENYLWIYTVCESSIWLISFIVIYGLSNYLDKKATHV